MELLTLSLEEKTRLLSEGWILGAAYERVSSGRQEKEETVDTQDHWIRHYCNEKKIILVDTYRDLACPSEIPVHERGDGRRLMTDAAAGRFEVVVVYKSGRWSRYDDVFQFGRKMLLKYRIDLICIKEQFRWKTASERFQARVVLAANEYEKDSLCENMIDGRYRVASQGLYTGGVVDYGYTLEPDKHESQRKRWILLEAEAEVVARMYHMTVVEFKSCRQIAHILTAEGVPTAIQNPEAGFRGHHKNCKTLGVWRQQMVAKLLRKTTYKGDKWYGGTIRARTLVKVPPIVTVEIWEKAQERLAANKRTSTRNAGANTEYLLSGKVWCPYCERNYVNRLRNHRADGTGCYYLYCQGTPEFKDGLRLVGCPVREFRSERLQEDVWARLVEHLSNHEETVARLVETWGTEQQEVEGLNRQRDKACAERERLESQKRLAMQGKSPMGFEVQPADAKELYEQSVNDLERNATWVRELDETIRTVGDRASRLKEIESHLLYWHEHIRSDLSFRTRRHVVDLFVDRIIVFKDDQGLHYRYRFQFDDACHPLNPGTDEGCKGCVVDKPTSRREFINYVIELEVRGL